MTVAKRKSSADDKIEAKRRIIRQSLDEIRSEIEREMERANLRSAVDIVVLSRFSLVTITGARDLPPDQWSLMSKIVRQVLGQKLGAKKLRGRQLTSSMAKATADI